MKTLLLIPIISLILYLIYVYWKYGMTHSISASYKKLMGREKFLFPITMWLIAIPIMIVGIEAVPDNWPEIGFFLAGSLICLIGASPEYWSGRMELTAHLIGSYGGIGIGMISCLIYLFNPFTVLSVLLYAAFVASQFFVKKLKISNHIYWLEVAAVIVVSAILYF